MARSRFFTQLLVSTVALAMAVPVFALDLPRGARLSIYDESGGVVGRGHVEGGEVELDLSRDAAGFGTLDVVLTDGRTVSYEVLFSAEGGLLVVEGDDIIDLREFVRESGREYDFDYEDDFNPARDDRGDDYDWGDDRDDWDDRDD